MVHWDLIKERKRKITRVVALLIGAFAALMLLGQTRSDATGEKAPKLDVVAATYVPLEEISGLELRAGAAGDLEITSVGDRASRIERTRLVDGAFAALGGEAFDGAVSDRFSPCASTVGRNCDAVLKNLNSQWEALHMDGGGNVFALQEPSRAIFAFAPDLKTVTGVINFDFALGLPVPEGKGKKKMAKRFDDQLSGEGFVLLKSGHILVAKERAPTVLAEFGPKGDVPIGLSAASLLAKGESFGWPKAASDTGVRREVYEPLALWTIKGPRGCDISEIATGPDAQLYVLSQSCRLLQRIEGLDPATTEVEVAALWRLSKKIKNPEGLAVTPTGDFVVGSDQRGAGDNVFLLRAKAP